MAGVLVPAAKMVVVNDSKRNAAILDFMSLRFFRAFKMFFNFFQGFALGFRQEECRRDEINHGAAGEDEEHRRVTVLADRRQKDRCNRRGYGLVDKQGDAHGVGTDAGRHQFPKAPARHKRRGRRRKMT